MKLFKKTLFICQRESLNKKGEWQAEQAERETGSLLRKDLDAVLNLTLREALNRLSHPDVPVETYF